MKIKIIFSISILICILISCQDTIKVNGSDEKAASVDKDTVIRHEEYTGTEPTDPEETEYYKPKVPRVNPGLEGSPPSDAVVLFDGKDLNQWISAKTKNEAKWTLNGDGSMTVADDVGSIMTKQNFGDIQLHIEWKSSKEEKGEGQHTGNSGIFLNGMYEIQVLNDTDTYVNGMVGSVYKQGPPLAISSAPIGEWNVFDMIYHAPKFNRDDEKIKSGTITIFHNGVIVQDHTEIKGTTPYIGWPKNPAHGNGPLILQAHGEKGQVSHVSYRNIWLREL
ncbi:MAG TPA: DUF1080 domain-containing protein [Pricia antarctica]|uniref:DUF1080 domain-containing protein n=2 Tax=root TaxID=1 RepID=A0A831VNQ0_9FLAO|nr:DUF1080 domain-containing protein [Pricia antarctica]